MTEYKQFHERGSGQTTEQLKKVKLNGIFICTNRRQVEYTKELARSLGREDIRIETLYWLENRYWLGLNIADLVVDHYTYEIMNRKQFEALIEAETRVGRSS